MTALMGNSVRLPDGFIYFLKKSSNMESVEGHTGPVNSAAIGSG